MGHSVIMVLKYFIKRFQFFKGNCVALKKYFGHNILFYAQTIFHPP